MVIHNNIKKEVNILGMNSNEWIGCFGVQSYINLSFLQRIQAKYDIVNLINTVTCRADRCCLERIFGVIFSIESPKLLSKKSLLGNIMTYQQWGYTFDQYMTDLKKGTLPRSTIKVWTGR
jgi:hypothetical protein